MSEAYTGPGVQAEVSTSPALAVGVSAVRVAYFTGTGSTTLQTTELITRDATSTIDELEQTGVEILSVYPLALYPPYAASTYELDGNGDIEWTDATAAPTAGDQYYVSYEYDKVAADYLPQEFTSIDAVTAIYGDIETGNSLSIAASLCFANGADTVGLVQIDPTASEYTAHKEALEKLELIDDAKVIVPLYTSTTFATAELKPHVLRMSAKTENKRRVGLVGLDETTEAIAVATWGELAESLLTNRVGLVYPGNITVVLDEGEVTLDGTYLAAAVAGVMTSADYDAAEPIMYKDLAGIIGVEISMNNTAKDLLASKGVMIVDKRGTTPFVRQGLTTDMSTISGQEITVTTGVDKVIDDISSDLQATYVGKKNLSATPGKVGMTFANLLQIAKDDEMITDFRNDTAFRSSTEPRKVICQAEVFPMFGVTWIKLEITLNIW